MQSVAKIGTNDVWERRFCRPRLWISIVTLIVFPAWGQEFSDLDGDGLAGKAELETLTGQDTDHETLFRFGAHWQRPVGVEAIRVIFQLAAAGAQEKTPILIATDSLGSFTRKIDLGDLSVIPAYADISPEGNVVLFLDRAFQPHSLYRTVFMGNQTPLLLLSKSVLPSGAMLAEDSWCAYSRPVYLLPPDVEQEPGIHVFNIDTDQDYFLLEYQHSICQPTIPTITADAQWVYYFDQADYSIKRINIDNPTPQTVVQNVALSYFTFKIAISGDGKKLVYDQFGDLIVYDTETYTKTTLTSDGVQAPHISTDGTTIVFMRGVQSYNQDGEIYAIQIDGIGERMLAPKGSYPCIQ